MEIHIPLPPKSKFNVPLVGAFLTKTAMDAIAKHRTDLFTPESPYRVMAVIPGKLWLARKR